MSKATIGYLAILGGYTIPVGATLWWAWREVDR